MYPFSAIVGQDLMKQALILNLIDPSIGGVLCFGDKGSAKSTAVRAIAQLVPPIRVIDGCKFSCDPETPQYWCSTCKELYAHTKPPVKRAPVRVIELPVSATEDRVVGSLDIERAINEGVKRFEPGLLAQANRGFLYIDEINLLDDHIVDLILDSAAMGVNTVEREGISFSHPAHFVLVGTMNPEEGELRPQLLDRFGLGICIEAISDTQKRIEIMKRRSAFEANSSEFMKEFTQLDACLAQDIYAARELLPSVEFNDDLLCCIARVSVALEVYSHRADLTFMRAARSYAALHKKTAVTIDDLCAVALMVYQHRLQTLPFATEKRIDQHQMEALVKRCESHD